MVRLEKQVHSNYSSVKYFTKSDPISFQDMRLGWVGQLAIVDEGALKIFLHIMENTDFKTKVI